MWHSPWTSHLVSIAFGIWKNVKIPERSAQEQEEHTYAHQASTKEPPGDLCSNNSRSSQQERDKKKNLERYQKAIKQRGHQAHLSICMIDGYTIHTISSQSQYPVQSK